MGALRCVAPQCDACPVFPPSQGFGMHTARGFLPCTVRSDRHPLPPPSSRREICGLFLISIFFLLFAGPVAPNQRPHGWVPPSVTHLQGPMADECTHLTGSRAPGPGSWVTEGLGRVDVRLPDAWKWKCHNGADALPSACDWPVGRPWDGATCCMCLYVLRSARAAGRGTRPASRLRSSSSPCPSSKT